MVTMIKEKRKKILGYANRKSLEQKEDIIKRYEYDYERKTPKRYKATNA